MIIIIIGFFYQIGVKPVDIGKFIGAKFGRAVGMSISIPENPFNRLAMQLQEKEDRLTQREKELDEREKELGKKSFLSDNTGLLMAGGIILLFVLVLVNFYLDYRRKRVAGKSPPPNKS